jgi:hypothetical protein
MSKDALGAQPGGVARDGAGVHLGQDLGQLHAARAEGLAVEEHGGHGHDLALLHLLLEQPAVDRHVAHARVEHRHQVQRLHDVRAVVAGQAHPGLEDQVPARVRAPGSARSPRLDLRRVAAGLQQRQHQRRELVPHRHGGEAHAHVRPARLIWNDGRRASAPSKRAVTRSDSDAMSSSSARISCEAARSSSEAISSTGCVMRSR